IAILTFAETRRGEQPEPAIRSVGNAISRLSAFGFDDLPGPFASIENRIRFVYWRFPMRKNDLKLIAFVFFVQLCLPGATRQAPAQAEKTAYPAMAPVDAYLIADRNSEVALARSAAPASISDGAEVMVLGRSGFTTAVKGTNGFLCVVER